MPQAGLMMNRPLLVSSILEHAELQWGRSPIVSRETHGEIFRYTYADCARRVRQLANAIAALGITPGGAIGTIAWNNHRHLESYYAVSGSGHILHTCNPRLHPDQLVYIINHAEDEIILFDSSFAALVDGIAQRCPKVGAWVCMSDRAHMPPMQNVGRLLCYEELIAPHSDKFPWPEFDEHCGAALCYTSGTTGNPKGALFSHRAIVLNAISICAPGIMHLSALEAVLGVVPMFHVNGWCLPYAVPICGAKMVLPGPKLDGASLYELMQTERVTVSAGVPTIWMQLAQHLEQHQLRFTSLKRIVSGGSALAISLVAKYADDYGVDVRQGWGMTETVAVATLSTLDGEQMEWPAADRHAVIAKQGKTVFGVEIKVVDEEGRTLPRDGESQGEVLIRGQWIVRSYYKVAESPLLDGWFRTGDIATIDPEGVLQIRDRAKDLIKTGGEWISSIDLENAAIGHPEVASAAVIGVKHPKWQERPLLFIVRKPNTACSREDILGFLGERVARWWVPEEVIFLETLPVGGTGKVQKAVLRAKYGNVFE
jgi:3-(methylthio)propionyl---CoA ligase